MHHKSGTTQPNHQQGMLSHNLVGYTSPSIPPPHHNSMISMYGSDVGCEKGAMMDDHQSTRSSEPETGKEDGSQPSGDGDSFSRPRGINSSKRAAQNRAAQRAFRLRRERYVASLEDKARSYDRLEAAYNELQRENHRVQDRLDKLYTENATLRAELSSGAPILTSLPRPMPGPLAPTALGSSVHRQSTMPAMTPEQDYQHTHQNQHYQQQQQQYAYTQQQSAHPEAALHVYGQMHGAHRLSPLHSTTAPSTLPPVNHSHMRPSGPSAAAPTAALGAHMYLNQQQRQQSPGIAYQYQQRLMSHPQDQKPRQERSLPHPDPRSSPHHTGTPGPAMARVTLAAPPNYSPDGFAMRSEQGQSNPAAFANPIERYSPLSGIRDSGPALETSTPGTRVSSYINSTRIEAAGTGPLMPSTTNANSAQILPSVREITRSIGEMLPGSPQLDSAQPSSSQFQRDGVSSGGQAEEHVESKRWPW
ncbi:hypothetical protein BX661DRAFT_169203 [Kickxella alabastrina]|uniref:uncharacterized protein n=1 Tax=Kickxella alabastrina TaxID=61397 RepID=UPI00221F78DE|nr:uncharacterized protein BX661DRAFT_169203 [Kickxella alabastrina]KAI7833352.1 hypothetical protein BX661DRAFT_169203 [Kickxella alabastrina]